MSDLAVWAPILIFLGVTLAMAVALTPRSGTVRARLESYATVPGRAEVPGEASRSLFDRLLLPGLQRLAGTINRAAPDTVAQESAKRLQQAGNPAGLTVGTFLLLKAVLLLVLPGAYGFYLWQHGGAGLLHLGILLGLCYVGYRAPDVWLDMQISARRAAVTRALPDALDLIVTCVAAGLGFEAALARVADRVKGPLSEEIRRTLAEMSMGKRRRDALRALADRSQAPDLVSFVAVVMQADQTGVSIGHVLRVQADALRVRRRQRAQEEGRKAPLKMLFPMIFFILPATFAVILGPAALSLMENFRVFGGR
ncbi:MAG: type II secretion system F family protein [Chloroflexi bacterium]|nr:type II secretion system F family protein [Chloroflexota bacterium]